MVQLTVGSYDTGENLDRVPGLPLSPPVCPSSMKAASLLGKAHLLGRAQGHVKPSTEGVWPSSRGRHARRERREAR